MPIDLPLPVPRKDLRVEVKSELIAGDQGMPCACDPPDQVPVGCMWHEYRHVVGACCEVCGKHWFFSADWSSPECRRERGLDV